MKQEIDHQLIKKVIFRNWREYHNLLGITRFKLEMLSIGFANWKTNKTIARLRREGLIKLHRGYYFALIPQWENQA